MKALLVLSAVAVLAIGCAPKPLPQPLSRTEVISMVKAGVTDEEIIRRIESTRTMFRLSSDDVVRLRNDGVSDRVVNHMLDTCARYVATEQRRKDYYDYPRHRGWCW